jgi:ABC-2 type transport system ATP-binding protein
MIEFEHVTRSYGKKTAVDNLNLKVEAGQLFALLGPNGAGKTTTIKMLVGLLQPSAGVVRICGYDAVRQPREAHQQVGLTPDEPYLYEKLTGREFLEFGADMHGLDRRDAAVRIRREVDQFELGEFLDDRSETYSHGMKQRMALAAAFLHDPAVLVMDEPMVGLDPRITRLVKDLLRAKAAAGTTVFMSTHSLGMAEEIANRIGIVDQGRLKFLGTIAELQAVVAKGHASLEHLYLELTASSRRTNGSATLNDAAAATVQGIAP